MPQNHGELDKITKQGRVSRVVDISCFSGATLSPLRSPGSTA